MSDSKKYKVHIISHTHWDRAWYLTFQEFRYRLVKLTDKLLNILESDPGYKSFHFDGQTIVLDDYVLIRPEKKPLIKRLIEEDRLVIGPWYVLNDEFIVSGESTIRNLLIGKQVGEEYGKVSTAGYVPDPFGHITQLPQILNGFSIDTFIFMRGMGENLEELGSEFIWKSPDGSELTAINQVSGYCNGGSLGFKEIWYSSFDGKKPDKELALQRIKNNIDKLYEYSTFKDQEVVILLVNNGCDHLEPQKELPELIKYVQDNLPEAEVIHSNYVDFLSDIKKNKSNFKSISGEIRSGRYQPLLNGVWSTRVYLKQLNYLTQVTLEQKAEPVSLICSKLSDYEYPQPFFSEAWKLLLKNHPHDNICGASTDPVHREMLHQYEMPNQIGEESIRAAVKNIGLRLNQENHNDAVPVTVFNSLAYKRNELVETIIQIPVEMNSENYLLEDENGNNIPVEIKGKYFSDGEWEDCQNRELNYNDQKERFGQLIFGIKNFVYSMPKEKTKILILDLSFYAKDVPAAGYKTYFLKKSDSKAEKGECLFDENNWKIENGLISVNIYPNGTFDLKDKKTGILYEGLNMLEDTEDVGDEYDYSYSKNSKTLYTDSCSGQASVLENTPQTARVAVDFDFSIPFEINQDREFRSNVTTDIPVSVEFTVNAFSPRVNIKTSVHNTAKDHRMRALFPTPHKTDKIFTSTQFGILERDIKVPEVENYQQDPQPVLPQQGYSCLENGKSGIAIHNEGLIEIEPVDSPSGVIAALTLFRSVGWLSRGDFLTRPYNAGPMIPTPEAQCLGFISFNYAVEPYEGNCFQAHIPNKNLDYSTPLIVFQPKSITGELPLTDSLLDINNPLIIQSALKRNELTGNICIRLFNSAKFSEKCILTTGRPVKGCWITDMKEERLKETPFSSNKIELDIPGYKILTVEIQI